MHAARVTLHGSIDKLFDFGEGDDLGELAIDLPFSHSEDGAVEVNVFASGQLGMKTRAHFQKGSDAPVNLCMAFRWFRDARENLQQRALPCSVAADYPNHVAVLDFEGNIVESPDAIRLPIADF